MTTLCYIRATQHEEKIAFLNDKSKVVAFLRTLFNKFILKLKKEEENIYISNQWGHLALRETGGSQSSI